MTREADALIDHNCLPSRSVGVVKDGAVVDPRAYVPKDCTYPLLGASAATSKAATP
ncbi:hypothetical protein GXW82_21005 [Streptacidiphilus sp. 4-A2]|nr:hypothetical protein [Streptacidiphilus sp. 4-A2]